MSMTYYTFVHRLASKMEVLQADYEFSVIIPNIIDYAEQRIYRELDLLATRVTDTSASFAVNTRTFSLPTATGTYLVVEELSAITPSTLSSSQVAGSGIRTPLQQVTKQFIDSVYPSATSGSSIPRFFAMLSNTDVLVGPSPDKAYPIEVIGTQRPTPLSASNSSTYLCSYLPDLFFAASMVAATNQARQASGRQQAGQDTTQWEKEYQQLLMSAMAEENRKKSQSQAWTTQQPNPIATPPRV